MASSSGSKAFFTNVDTGSVFFVQFNPKEFKMDESASWKASDEHENDVPLLTYEKGEPTVVSMDLVFDSTDDGSDVYKKYVEPLRDFLTADVQVTDGEGDKMKRPPYCKFTWASFSFDCVVEKLSATCLMFKPDGTALRAKVQVGLKERVRHVNGGGTDSVTLSAVGSLFRGAASKAVTYTTQNGDTLSSIAAKTKARLADIALANDIEDPMDIPPGQQLVIPADPRLARILAGHGRRRHRGKWKNGNGGQGPRARGGYMGGAPSAFEDPPVPLDYDVDPGGIALQYASFGKLDYDVRDDSERGEGGEGIGLGVDKDSAAALAFRDLSTPEKQGALRAALDYKSREDSEQAGGTGGQGIGLGVDKDSEQAGGTGGQGSGGYDVEAGGIARHFRNDATPDEQGSGPRAQGYDVRGDSEGAFGTAGQGSGGYDTRDGGLAGHFRNDATPDEQGAGPNAQNYDVRGDSEGTFGDAGEGAGGYGTRAGGLAGHFRNDATPDEQGSGPTAQGYGVRGDSEGTFGDAGEGGGGYGTRAGSLAGHFRNDATPDAQGAGPTAQSYGGHGGSDGTFGTAGEGGGPSGTFGRSEGTFGTAGEGGGPRGGFSLSDRADGTSGQGSGPGGGVHHLSDQAAGTVGGAGGDGGGRGFHLVDGAGGAAGEGAGGGRHLGEHAAQLRGAGGTEGMTYGGYGLSDNASGTAGEGSSGGGHGLSDQATGPRTSGDGGPRDSFKDLLKAHGRVDGEGDGAGGESGPRDGADLNVSGAGGMVSTDGGGRHKEDFKDAFQKAKAAADKKKNGE